MFWTYVASFASAVVGGAIGAIAILMVYRGERRARRAEVFNAALADLIREMSELAGALRRRARGGNRYVRGQSLDRSKVVTALTIAQLVATQDEFEVLQRLASPVAFVVHAAATFWEEAGYFDSWAAELMIWRRGMVTGDKAQVDFLDAEKTFLKEMGVPDDEQVDP
jgi:hypothetical protein